MKFYLDAAARKIMSDYPEADLRSYSDGLLIYGVNPNEALRIEVSSGFYQTVYENVSNKDYESTIICPVDRPDSMAKLSSALGEHPHRTTLYTGQSRSGPNKILQELELFLEAIRGRVRASLLRDVTVELSCRGGITITKGIDIAWIRKSKRCWTASTVLLSNFQRLDIELARIEEPLAVAARYSLYFLKCMFPESDSGTIDEYKWLSYLKQHFERKRQYKAQYRADCSLMLRPEGYGTYSALLYLNGNAVIAGVQNQTWVIGDLEIDDLDEISTRLSQVAKRDPIELREFLAKVVAITEAKIDVAFEQLENGEMPTKNYNVESLSHMLKSFENHIATLKTEVLEKRRPKMDVLLDAITNLDMRIELLDQHFHGVELEETPLTRLEPAPRIVTDWKEAEKLAAEWLDFFGLGTAIVTQAVRDGGIDVESPFCVAQVKDYGNAVAAGPVRELAAIAMVENKQAVFFARAGFTKDAVNWADRAAVSLFSFDLQGHLVAHGLEAAKLMS